MRLPIDAPAMKRVSGGSSSSTPPKENHRLPGCSSNRVRAVQWQWIVHEPHVIEYEWRNGLVRTVFDSAAVRRILDFPTPHFSEALPAGFEPALPP
jgi:hypothetical protein